MHAAKISLWDACKTDIVRVSYEIPNQVMTKIASCNCSTEQKALGGGGGVPKNARGCFVLNVPPV